MRMYVVRLVRCCILCSFALMLMLRSAPTLRVLAGTSNASLQDELPNTDSTAGLNTDAALDISDHHGDDWSTEEDPSTPLLRGSSLEDLPSVEGGADSNAPPLGDEVDGAAAVEDEIITNDSNDNNDTFDGAAIGEPSSSSTSHGTDASAVDIDKWEVLFSNRQHVHIKPAIGDATEQNGTLMWRCPILRKHIDWMQGTITSTSVVQKDGLVYALFAIKDTIMETTRIGLAWGIDGINFHSVHPEPVVFPDTDRWSKYEWSGGCKEPRVVKGPGGVYVMTYNSQNKLQPRILVATSYDLIHWNKHGPAFAMAHRQTFLNAWSTSGAILAEPAQDGSLIAAKINGTYWMYWGEHNVHLATSTDLIAWVPVLSPAAQDSYRAHRDHVAFNPNSFAAKPLSVLKPRKGKFDSDSVDPGPVALLREDGIMLVYNAKNLKCKESDTTCNSGHADKQYALGSRQLGEALFSRKNPRILLDRSKRPIFSYMSPDDRLYATGLIFFNHKWLLYHRGQPLSQDPRALVSVSFASGYSHTGVSLDLYEEEDEDFLYDEGEDPAVSEKSIMEDTESYILELSKEELSELSDEDSDRALQERIFWRLKDRLSRIKAHAGESRIKRRKHSSDTSSDGEDEL